VFGHVAQSVQGDTHIFSSFQV